MDSEKAARRVAESLNEMYDDAAHVTNTFVVDVNLIDKQLAPMSIEAREVHMALGVAVHADGETTSFPNLIFMGPLRDREGELLTPDAPETSRSVEEGGADNSMLLVTIPNPGVAMEIIHSVTSIMLRPEDNKLVSELIIQLATSTPAEETVFSRVSAAAEEAEKAQNNTEENQS